MVEAIPGLPDDVCSAGKDAALLAMCACCYCMPEQALWRPNIILKLLVGV